MLAIQSLLGNWTLENLTDGRTISGCVPGSVMADYLREGLIPNPHFRENEDIVKPLFENDFSYSTSFSVNTENLSSDHQIIVFEGLDTLAEVTLNGILILTSDDMHRRFEVDVKGILKQSNTLMVVLRSPLKFIAEAASKAEVNCPAGGCLAGNNFLRKAHCMFGWDWGPQLPDAGIWKEVRLEFYDGAKLQYVYPVQKHENGSVYLTINAELIHEDGAAHTLVCELTDPNGKTRTAASAGEKLFIEIDDPMIWWPNGLGDQPLYNLKTTLYINGKVQNTLNQRIGLRTVTVSTTPDPDRSGAEFAFVVNGCKFFSTGANYIPEDNILSRVTTERTYRLIRDCCRGNMNTIRVWGGGHYPTDAFYDACDEYGILVWEDLMFACNAYDFMPHFEENCVNEIIDNVKRIRHHASLALWCGNNEIEQGWEMWYPSMIPSRKYWADYYIMFEYVFPKLVKQLDPATFYWHSSPSSGDYMRPERKHLNEYHANADNIGDAHYYGVWLQRAPYTEYRNHLIRFCSEFAFQSLPCKKTMDTVLLPQDKNLFSAVMDKHQKNELGNGLIMHYVAKTYRNPKDFDSLTYVSQLMQANAISYAVEHWRRHRPYCMGSLFWQLNDIWPGVSWSTIDYYGRWKAMHYACKHIYAPFTVSVLDEGARMGVYIHNETRFAKVWRLELYVKNMINDSLWKTEISGSAEPFTAIEVFGKDYTDIIRGREREVYFGYKFFDENGFVFEDVQPFTQPKNVELPEADIRAVVSETEYAFAIDLNSSVFAYKVQLELSHADAIFSDNYIPLTGCTRRIIVQKSDLSEHLNLDEFRHQLEIRSLVDTYE